MELYLQPTIAQKKVTAIVVSNKPPRFEPYELEIHAIGDRIHLYRCTNLSPTCISLSIKQTNEILPYLEAIEHVCEMTQS